MDRLINNEINNKTNEKSNEINEFMGELQNALEDPKNKISIDKSLYDEIYNDLVLAPKYKEQLENIIKDCMLDCSYDNDFIYVNYDEKAKKYYVDIYDGEVTKVNVTKKDIQDADLKVGDFYYQMRDWKYFEEYDYMKEYIKNKVEYQLNNLEKNNNRRKNG